MGRVPTGTERKSGLISNKLSEILKELTTRVAAVAASTITAAASLITTAMVMATLHVW